MQDLQTHERTYVVGGLELSELEQDLRFALDSSSALCDLWTLK